VLFKRISPWKSGKKSKRIVDELVYYPFENFLDKIITSLEVLKVD